MCTCIFIAALFTKAKKKKKISGDIYHLVNNQTDCVYLYNGVLLGNTKEQTTGTYQNKEDSQRH